MKKIIILNGEQITYELIERKEKSVTIKIGETEYVHNLESSPDGTTSYLMAGSKRFVSHKSRLDAKRDHLFVGGREWSVEFPRATRGAGQSEEKGGLLSPMPGKIFKILVKEGDIVAKGQVMLIMEAMKMEHAIKAPAPSQIDALLYKEGDLVQGGVELIRLRGIEE